MGKLRAFSVVLLSAAPTLAIAGPATAAAYVWNFDNPLGSVNSSHAYKDTTNSFSLFASGYKTTSASPASPSLGQTWGPSGGYNFSTGTITPIKLYGKVSTPDETGLGLDGLDDDHEIQPNSFVQLNLSDFFTHGLTNLTMSVSSVQTYEGFYVWGSNSPGIPGILLKIGRNPNTGGVEQSFPVPQYGAYTYISVSATPSYPGHDSDILIRNGLTATAPEPATLLLICVGGLLMRRRQRALPGNPGSPGRGHR